ncbi:glycosyltransferase family A protein [Photorhabdus heterorhabditis]|uniref:glycosyltransferase family A protein n=1 Tax=Photorhabdus heterorhabditis TaxID=880156 RepID=UPI0015627D3C|nr:glycosyltransferase family A protein [Photorhabdus heterorhabditis]NRN27057.1 glycosyltransferase family 2 protein [Photorhabdus heterorhabditis subsp. aluminescens]
MSGISVITLTRYRPMEVRRAILSVQRQTDPAAEHIVLVDGDRRIEESVKEFIDSNGIDRCKVHFVSRTSGDVSGPGRSSVLRNIGVQMAKNPWIAFLDDDNEWLPNHLSSLRRLACQSNSPAVYSEVALLTATGELYLEYRWPWASTHEEGERKYWDYVAQGVLVPGSNVIHDSPEVRDVPVDTSAWLLDRNLLLSMPFQEKFSVDDARTLTSEDDKLFYSLLECGVLLACTSQPTLLYYLGGYSNSCATVRTNEPIEWSNTE